MQESKTRSEKRNQLPEAAVPQKEKFSLDDPLALCFSPCPKRTEAACQLLDQDGHSPLTSPRKTPICRDIKIQPGEGQFLFGLEAHRSLSSQAALFLYTAHFVLVSLGVTSPGGGAAECICVESNRIANIQPQIQAK